jgi:predicted O-methyltransferase YrrM
MKLSELPAAVCRFLPKYIFGSLSSLYLFTLGVFRARHRYLVWQICRHFGWPDRRPASIIPPLSPKDIVPEDIDVRVLEPSAVSGNVALHKLLILNRLVRRSGCTRVLEIGTFDGRTALNLAANMPETGRILTLNLPEDQLGLTAHEMADGELDYVRHPETGCRFTNTPYSKMITQLLGDSASFDFEPYYGSMDLVFVDGSHAHDYVLNDSRIALQLLRPAGGIILWHDFLSEDWPDVTNALNELFHENPAFAGLKHISGTSLALLETAVS